VGGIVPPPDTDTADAVFDLVAFLLFGLLRSIADVFSGGVDIAPPTD
jgi:hypothetical protein